MSQQNGPGQHSRHLSLERLWKAGKRSRVWFKHGELLPKENQSLGILFYCLVGDIMSPASNLAITSSLLRHICVVCHHCLSTSLPTTYLHRPPLSSFQLSLPSTLSWINYTKLVFGFIYTRLLNDLHYFVTSGDYFEESSNVSRVVQNTHETKPTLGSKVGASCLCPHPQLLPALSADMVNGGAAYSNQHRGSSRR